jgi:protein-L-isoaspartate(D-aspartate) O-methyltransferase
MAWASGSADPRLHTAFRSVHREDFLPPGPWRLHLHGTYRDTPDADPAILYQNILVALDEAKGINNGEPYLHAAWIGAVALQPDDTICHIGAGTGYYTAILAALGGRVTAYEIDDGLAAQARRNLGGVANVSVVHADAARETLAPADLIYVNAGVAVPPATWLSALKPNGRMIFPWRPAPSVGLALILRPAASCFAVEPLMPAWFIPCVGASKTDACSLVPGVGQARATRSAWLTARRLPDATATAVYPDAWFSAAAP